ncbi:TetR/AcrR family transcriptional regulator [Streptomyces triticagri]|uniref:TetR/AcrR family transcriptional regulator n=1 Tax=Streptomyces triticagri TaxID=2293568 RepID=A0A372M474_9ACTN|nr:TetR/AcrR family transcriptional regulator [Streptomyces triticagri]RFU85410.1 TetR/AcrR family transcriptional regulator [Streptomyces triticagri]
MTTSPTPRRRAPGMSPEQRREMIIKAAIPLIGEYGAAVTTSKIAAAAGIGEATVFRVFADKDELLAACVAEAVRPDHAVRELGSISLEQPLAGRLSEAAEALQAHLARIGMVVGSLHASGHRRREGRSGEQPRGAGRDESLATLRASVAELLAPDNGSLRLPAEQIAALFLGLLFTQPRKDDEPQLTAAELVDVFLHGALTTPPPAESA